MRTEVKLERKNAGYQIRLTKAQHWLLVNSLSAMLESIQYPGELDLMLGPAGARLEELFSAAVPAEAGSRIVLDVSCEEAHSIYALLICLPSLFSTEETFHRRVGAYRENLIGLAAGLSSAIREVNQ